MLCYNLVTGLEFEKNIEYSSATRDESACNFGGALMKGVTVVKMERSKIERINYLARKKKSEGLTPAEIKEQAELRSEYIRDIRISFRATLDSIEFETSKDK